MQLAVNRRSVGLGVVWIAQLLPFHRSANDAGAALLLQ